MAKQKAMSSEEESSKTMKQEKGRRRRRNLALRLRINEKYYNAGDCIQGKISMFVPQTGTHDFSGIHVSLVGYETVKLHRELSDTTSLQETHRKVVVRLSTEVVPLPPLLIEGQFEYPFCWQLPTDKTTLPVSMSCSSNNSDASSCKLQYSLTAYLSSSKSSNESAGNNKKQQTTIFSRKPICIISSGQNDTSIGNNNNNRGTDNDGDNENSSTIIVEPEKFKVKSWVKNKGHIEMGVNSNTSVASPNSKFAVSITGRGNLSSAPVKNLLVQLVETVQWGANYDDERVHCRILAQKLVCVKNAPQWQVRQQKHHDESPASDNEISTLLALKNSARDSYEGHLIKVRHSINVTAITSGCLVTNPQLTTTGIKVRRRQQLKLLEQYGRRNIAPIVVKGAQSSFSSLDDITDSTDDSNYPAHFLENNQIVRTDIEIPQAVSIVDGDDC